MRILISTIIFSMTMVTHSFAQENDPFHAVEKLFAAISAYDYDGMFSAGTDDFQLLEDGEVWTMQRLADAVKRAEGDLARRNFFSIIKTVNKADSVWISYWNKALLTLAEDRREVSVAWLESVVLVRDGGEWKVEMMHSTHIGDENMIPSDVVMEEYVGSGAFKLSD